MQENDLCRWLLVSADLNPMGSSACGYWKWHRKFPEVSEFLCGNWYWHANWHSHPGSLVAFTHDLIEWSGENSMDEIQTKRLVEVLAMALADYPEEVNVKEISGQNISVIEVRAAKVDLGKIIGKQGRNADALRTLVNATATKLRKRVVLEIIEWIEGGRALVMHQDALK
jgi:uncharacterized protein